MNCLVMMRVRGSTLWRAIATLAFVIGLTACGAAVRPSDGSVAVGSDVAMADAVCVAAPLRPTPGSCAGDLRVIGRADTRVMDRVPNMMSFAMTGIESGADTARPSCEDHPLFNGGDVKVRFEAPAGGRWRLTARGFGLHAITAKRGCGPESICGSFEDWVGPNTITSASVDVQAQRNESFELILDGCPAGERCTYELRAERVGILQCPTREIVCPQTPTPSACLVDPCDAELFICEPQPTRDELRRIGFASGTALVDRAQAQLLLTAQALNWPANLQAYGDALFVEWLAAGGASLGPSRYVGSVGFRDAVLTPTQLGNVPPTATSARFWLLAEQVPEQRPAAERDVGSVLLEFQPWVRRAVGEACTPNSLLTRCETNHRCEAPEGSSAAICVLTVAPEIRSLLAWKDVGRDTLALQLRAISLADGLTVAEVVLLDDAGAEIGRLPTLSLLARGGIYTAGWTRFEPGILAQAVAISVRAQGPSRVFTEPVRAVINLQRTVGVTASCSAQDVSCAPDLRCANSGTADATCEPEDPPRVCGIPSRVGIWAPRGPGMHTLRGVVLSAQGGTRCDISRTYHGANTEFIAPRTGHYRFSTEGTTTLEVGAVCGAPMCQRGMGSLNAEIDLMAGQHIPINTGVSNGTRNAPFSMSVLVP